MLVKVLKMLVNTECNDLKSNAEIQRQKKCFAAKLDETINTKYRTAYNTENYVTPKLQSYLKKRVGVIKIYA